ncbi:hypothetical protein ACFPRL_36475 [Pseudoclavibacter helvolus]
MGEPCHRNTNGSRHLTSRATGQRRNACPRHQLTHSPRRPPKPRHGSPPDSPGAEPLAHPSGDQNTRRNCPRVPPFVERSHRTSRQSSQTTPRTPVASIGPPATAVVPPRADPQNHLDQTAHVRLTRRTIPPSRTRLRHRRTTQTVLDPPAAANHRNPDKPRHTSHRQTGVREGSLARAARSEAGDSERR